MVVDSEGEVANVVHGANVGEHGGERDEIPDDGRERGERRALRIFKVNARPFIWLEKG